MRLSTIWAAIAILVVLAFAGWASAFTVPIQSKPSVFQDVLAQLGVLFVIAVFIERAVEVYICSRRAIGKGQLEEDVAAAQASGVADDITTAKKALAEYSAKTQIEALVAALVLGLCVALGGVRVLGIMLEVQTAPAADASSTLGGFQRTILDLSDVAIVAGLLAGGSQPIHQIISTITDFFANTRKNMAA